MCSFNLSNSIMSINKSKQPSNQQSNQNTSDNARDKDRHNRLAKALKDNLFKRKQQQRAKKSLLDQN